MYGICKVYNELLGEYNFQKYGLDYRSLRYPGVMSAEKFESHGTTDYSSEIFHAAREGESYVCPLKND